LNINYYGIDANNLLDYFNVEQLYLTTYPLCKNENRILCKLKIPFLPTDGESYIVSEDMTIQFKKDEKECPICMGDYEVGDKILRKFPCKVGFFVYYCQNISLFYN
jgi:hypothetical protein